MDGEWIGRRIMQASRTLGERLLDAHPGPGAPVVAQIAGPLLREVGRSVALGERDPQLPLVRTRVLWRVPTELSYAHLAAAFNTWGLAAQDYVRQLPGLDAEHERFVVHALRHGVGTLLAMRHRLLGGERPEDLERFFGGAVALAFPRSAAG